jgi:hypothetical protein
MTAALEDVASGLDHLAVHLGAPVLLSPDNLVWNDGSAAIVDFGTEPLVGLIESSYDGPRIVPLGRLEALYPQGLLRHGSDLGPAFSLASVYFALRTGHGVFAPPGQHRRDFRGHARACETSWQAYMGTGRLALDEIPDGRERALLAQALDRDLERRHGSARELAAELRGL